MQPRIGSAQVVIQKLEEPKENEFARADAVTVKHTYPLKILVPEYAADGNCRWIFPITFGGGLVGGDKLSVDIEVRDNCCALLTSQESTKIYHCEANNVTFQDYVFNIGRDAMLCVIPDYLVCYKDANYNQNQIINMPSSGNLVYLDWLTAGRIARNEEWQFKRYINKLEINVDGERVFKDQVELQDLPCMSVKRSMKKYKVLATCIILGDRLADMCANLQKKLGRTKKYGERYHTDLVCSVSKMKTSMCGVYIRILSTTTSQAFSVVQEILQPLIPVLGADPFQNKYY